ncbi:MAG: ferrochelatase, partial [Gammaproteobacteria bacterium]|nr:ferrochelatase [Gammaproteobacteria bacterium]
QRNVDQGDPYFSHCQQTASLLADKLQLKPDQWKMTFQSRFGRAEWIKPYTQVTLQEWGEQGIKNVAILCPGFPSDCLETLEEITVENKNFFIEAGGKEFHYIPALNDSDEHINVLAGLVHNINKNGA